MKLWTKQKAAWNEIFGIVFVIADAAMLGVSAYLCFSSDIWYDELFTMGLANQSCGKLISTTARDVHPPLYYMIVRLFLLLFGGMGKGIAYQVTVAKLVSVIPFFLCGVYALTKVRRHFGLGTAGLFCFLLPAMPKLADYTVEVRMYGWALFFVTAGMLHAYELARGEKGKSQCVSWIALTLYGLAACYTHYFACVAFCMVYLYLFLAFLREGRLKKEIKGFLCSGFFCAAGYLPWLICAFTVQLGQVKANYWIQPLTWRSLGGCVKFVFQFAFSGEILGTVLGIALLLSYGGLVVGALVRYWRGKAAAEDRQRTFFVLGCIGVLIGTVLFGFLASVLIRPVFVYRYMMPALGVFWLAFAILFMEIKDKKIYYIPLVAAIFFVGVGNYRAFYGEEMWKRVQMEKAEEAFSQIKRNDVIIYNFDQTQAVTSYYLSNDTYLWYGKPEQLIREMYPKNHPLVEEEFSDEAGIEALRRLLFSKKENSEDISKDMANKEKISERKVWFLGSGNAREEIIEKWKAAGIEAEEMASVMVERYWFNVYELSLVE
ncbi:MAG: hypothetical protein NC400_06710 [Clostridium sp.]|nr:hypothetical protein [Clostridium sp.]